MNLFGVLNWLLAQSHRLPEVMSLLDSSVDLSRKWSAVITGSPAISATELALQSAPLSPEESTTVNKIREELIAHGLGPDRITAALPYLRLLEQSGLLAALVAAAAAVTGKPVEVAPAAVVAADPPGPGRLGVRAHVPPGDEASQ